MIPDTPRECDEKSHEVEMFRELEKLSDDYYVFHSFEIVSIKDNVIRESETDFVIFHPKKGIICLEAKAGQVEYINGYWQYASGKKMKHNGPYIQAKRNKWNISEYMKDNGMEYEDAHCKKIHAVWFPDVPESKFVGQRLPGEGDIKITLTSDSFGHIEECIDKLYSYDGQDHATTQLSEKDVDRILNRVLAPAFHLISLAEVEKEHTKHVFKRMLREQVTLLNYLDEQNNAIINGLAGTGKTVMAVEKARRHSEKGEKVLFLCYNTFLKEYLKRNYSYPNVSYYTIDGLACKLCGTEPADYLLLQHKLEEMYCNDTFPYQHVIIDEGQDFGKDELEEERLVDLLKSNAIDNESRNGTFYLFYDKNQMVQSRAVPQYIMDADCKLTLYRNCRNTQNIALTSLRLLGSSKDPKLIHGAIPGDNPTMCFASDAKETKKNVDHIIKMLVNDGYSDIVILTCKTEDTSLLSDYCNNSVYKYEKGKCIFTTCRKFKGLEADAIIVIDIDKSTFDGKGEQLMYVGSSRARYKLNCIMNLTEEDCVDILDKRDAPYKKNVFKSFATAFNSKYQNYDAE